MGKSFDNEREAEILNPGEVISKCHEKWQVIPWLFVPLGLLKEWRSAGSVIIRTADTEFEGSLIASRFEAVQRREKTFFKLDLGC